jgi:hypothetical protein
MLVLREREESKFVGGNHIKKLARYYELHLITPSVDDVDVVHDQECWSRLYLDCTCDPVIKVNGNIVPEGWA